MAGSLLEEPAFLPVCSPAASMDASPLRLSLYPHDRGRAFLDCWPRSNAACVLFLPGSMLSPLHYHVFLQALMLEGFSVAALHATGHGASRHRGPFHCARLLEDVHAAVDCLRHHGQHSEIILCGHSQGGILALAAAGGASWPDGQYIPPLPHLRACFAISAVYPQHAEAVTLTRLAPLAAYRQGIMSRLARWAQRFPGLPVPLPCYLSPRRILAGCTRWPRLSRRERRFTYPLRFLYSLFSLHAGTTAAVPVHLLGAPDDALFTPALLQTTFERLHAPDKTLAWLPSGGHLCLMQAAGASHAARYLAEHLPPLPAAQLADGQGQHFPSRGIAAKD